MNLLIPFALKSDLILTTPEYTRIVSARLRAYCNSVPMASSSTRPGELPPLPADLWIQIFAYFGDDDETAARVSATCREWRQHVRDGYEARFSMAVHIARNFLTGLPRVDASGKGTCECVFRF